MRLSRHSEALALALAACGGSPPAPEAPPPAPPPAARVEAVEAPVVPPPPAAPSGTEDLRLRGTLTPGSPAVFATCAGQPPPLEGLEGAVATVRERLGSELGSTYVELALERAATPGAYRVRAVDVAIVEGPGCAQPADFDLRATGGEPGWVLTLVGQEALILTQNEGRLPRVELQGPVAGDGGLRTWTGTLGDGRALVLRVAAEACQDTMASAFYPLTVKLRLGDADLTGCARPRPPVP